MTGVNQSYYFDVSSVQVLKGPQGTLFGLSNDAGAILYEPTKPTNNYEGYVQATLGNYGRGRRDQLHELARARLAARRGGSQAGRVHAQR